MNLRCIKIYIAYMTTGFSGDPLRTSIAQPLTNLSQSKSLHRKKFCRPMSPVTSNTRNFSDSGKL